MRAEPDRNLLILREDPVLATHTAGSRQIYVRRLSQLQATPLSGTDNAVGPFFSPDGQWIAFFADGKLRKIAATGGPAVTLCDAPNARGAPGLRTARSCSCRTSWEA